jgi:hypothetical protein
MELAELRHRHRPRRLPVVPAVLDPVRSGDGHHQRVRRLRSPDDLLQRLIGRGATASGIAFSATSAVVQTALQGLSTIGAGNVTVTGGPANTTALVLTFGGTLANTPLELIQVNTAGLTGATGGIPSRTTPGAFADTYYGIDLWHEDSMNVSAKPLLLTLPSKDNLGAVCRLIIGLYKCQFGPIGFDGPSFKDGFKVNYEATALMSSTDELGVAFADGKKRIGRLISIL